MAQNTRMQQRYGTYSQFLADKNNLLPHELASVASGDPNTADGKSLNFAFAPGDTKRLMTAEDAQDEIQAAASQATADAEESAQKAQDYYNKIAPAVENAKDEPDNYTDALKGTIPLDYTELSEKVQQMEIMKAPVIQGKDSGEFVALSDSGNIPTKNVRLFGKSVQAETTGVQLFNVNVCKNETDLQYKITIDDYATGKITVSMDNQEGAVAMPVNRLSDYCPTMTAGKTYYLSGKHDGSSNGDISLVDVSDTWDFGTSREITEQDLQSAVQFGFGTYSNIMIVEGSTEKPYEVYTGGEAATEPTPDYPLPITSAGNYDAEKEKYEISVSATGTQLLKLQDVNRTGSGITVMTLEDGGYKITGRNISSDPYYFRVSDNLYLQKGTYTLGQIFIGSGSCFFYDDGSNFLPNDTTTKTKTFDKQIIVRPYIWVRGNSVIDCIIYPILNVGDKLLPFEPFKQQLTTLQLPNPLRGIPVDSGGNYTDADGQQWICDYIDRERGKYVQCVKEIVFDGDEEWGMYSDSAVGYHRFIISVSGYKFIYTTINIMCDKFSVERYMGSWAFDKNVMVLYPDSNFRFVVSDKLTRGNVEGFKEWLAKNNVRVLYPLDIPIETDLTPDQIAALNLSTYQGITNIGTDTMPQVGVEVEYGCDTKIYIDNKFTELAQSLAATQNQILGGN